MLNDLKTHDPIEPACSGKTGKIPVGGNAYFAQIVTSKRLDSNEISASSLKF
jgi:hypothetical protein